MSRFVRSGPERMSAPLPSASHSYLVYTFQSGQCGGIWTTARTATEAIQRIREHRHLTEAYARERMIEIVETEITFLGRYPSGVKKGYWHTFSNVEAKRPHTLFIGAISREDLDVQEAAAIEAAIQKEVELQLRIKAVAHLTAKTVVIEELPKHWKHRVRQTTKGCWVWQTEADVGPYKDAYISMKGPVPEGAVLRHSCDNRRCINPNHLTLGSPRDNVRDMVARYRHPSQKRFGKRRKMPR